MNRIMTSLGALTALIPALAAAHPEHEVVQGAYLTLAGGTVQLELDLSPGPEVAAAFVRTLDANNDKHVTDAEAHAFAVRVLGQSSLTLDGDDGQWTLSRVETPTYEALTKEGATLKIHAAAPRAETGGNHVLTYDNRYNPAESRCVANVFLTQTTGWAHEVTGQQHGPDGRRLTVRYVTTRA